LSKNEIDFNRSDWKLLEGQRVTKKDSFDFIIETVGVFSNRELLEKACSILVQKLKNFDTLIETSELQIESSDSTIKNSYDIILKNEDYTLGKALEYALYSKFYEGSKTMTFCGFKKMHPHDSDSIIRISYKEDTNDKSTLQQNLKICIQDLINVYETIKKKI